VASAFRASATSSTRATGPRKISASRSLIAAEPCPWPRWSGRIEIDTEAVLPGSNADEVALGDHAAYPMGLPPRMTVVNRGVEGRGVNLLADPGVIGGDPGAQGNRAHAATFGLGPGFARGLAACSALNTARAAGGTSDSLCLPHVGRPGRQCPPQPSTRQRGITGAAVWSSGIKRCV
jgi:hypothetical protein